MTEGLVSIQKLVTYAHYSRVTCLGLDFLKESLIFVSFGLLFLD